MYQKKLSKTENNLTELLLLSWNVNGIRAVEKKGFTKWLAKNKPDIICLQETKSQINQLNVSLRFIDNYYTYWFDANRKGYSGTAIFSREKPINIYYGLGIEKFDNEGRVIIAEFIDFYIINSYFPNGGKDNKRLDYKIDFHNEFLNKCNQLLKTGKTLIFCGDINIAHKEIDLANPQKNIKKTGFLPKEREWIDNVVENNYIDTFRYFYPNKEKCYTWWSYMNNARKNNSGWRLDYFFVNKSSINNVTDSFIMQDVLGSDHCPVGIKYKIKERERILKTKEKRVIQPTLF